MTREHAPMNPTAESAAPVALPAGEFSAWLRAMRGALAGGAGMQVACGECVGCCTSSYYIKVRAHETETLRRIDPAHLLPEADEPGGTRLMGYDAQGRCPMFRDGGCSIYLHRPETCRTYDCRIFTAAGMKAGDGRTEINQRIARWRFTYASDTGRQEHRAVTAAANFLRQHPVRFPNGHIPSRPGDVAVLAVKSYEVFLHPPASDAEAAAGIIAACRKFDQQRPGA
jgi:Fe-S-cluster containining protein